jgi:hypothetical protein
MLYIPETLNRTAVINVIEALDNARLALPKDSMLRMQADLAMQPFLKSTKEETV